MTLGVEKFAARRDDDKAIHFLLNVSKNDDPSPISTHIGCSFWMCWQIIRKQAIRGPASSTPTMPHSQPRHAQTAALSALRRCGQLLPPSLAVIRAAEKESASPKGEWFGALAVSTAPMAVLAVSQSSLRGAHARQPFRLAESVGPRSNGYHAAAAWLCAVTNRAESPEILSVCTVAFLKAATRERQEWVGSRRGAYLGGQGWRKICWLAGPAWRRCPWAT